MLANVRALLSRHAYLTAIAIGALWNLLWVTSRPITQAVTGYIVSGVLVGFIVGFSKVDRRSEIPKKLPQAFGCYLIVGVFFHVVDNSMEKLPESMFGPWLELGATLLVTIATSPTLLIGEFLGWLLSLVISERTE